MLSKDEELAHLYTNFTLHPFIHSFHSSFNIYIYIYITGRFQVVNQKAFTPFWPPIACPLISLPRKAWMFRFKIHHGRSDGLEDGVEFFCRLDAPTVIMCDRGTMDGSTYMDKTVGRIVDWSFDKRKFDNPYNAVFHMVSAADGATGIILWKQSSTHRGNAKMARMMDENTKKAWSQTFPFIYSTIPTDFEEN
jgi:hypothetical protein